MNDLRWREFTAPTSGSIIQLVDWMGTDRDIVQAARVSYGKNVDCLDDIPQKDFVAACEACGVEYQKGALGFSVLKNPNDQEKVWQKFVEQTAESEEKLLRMLMRHRHTTPFEMVEVKLRVKIPMDLWRQWIRHRTANVNEYSTRYKPAIDETATTLPGEWRVQSQDNKQGSSGYLEDYPEGWSVQDVKTHWKITGSKVSSEIQIPKEDMPNSPSVGEMLSYWERKVQKFVRTDYDIRRELKVANEQARKDLPLSTFTQAYWKCDLHNIFHFLALRMDSHAQKEIRECATIIGEEIIAKLFPMAWDAFKDYRLNAMNLTAQDIYMVRLISDVLTSTDFVSVEEEDFYRFYKNTSKTLFPKWTDREVKECLAKMRHLNLVTPELRHDPADC